MALDVFGGMRLRSVRFSEDQWVAMDNGDRQNLFDWLFGIWGLDVWADYSPGDPDVWVALHKGPAPTSPRFSSNG
ncbi:hypothetical protein [Celeribacter halophilus]|uniref:hypothetical protein n=1 Tax=Celeribacter halophilus TaxID=576117 RepID=UPI000829C5BD|nr:hypothetical protein [Celeribacter halophilus]